MSFSGPEAVLEMDRMKVKGPEEDEKEMVVENAKGLEVCGEYGMFE